VKSHFFDLDRVISESGLPAEKVDEVLAAVRKDIPEDDPLFELKVVRALDAAVHQTFGTAAWRHRLGAES
jgi:hypothetical protein